MMLAALEENEFMQVSAGMEKRLEELAQNESMSEGEIENFSEHESDEDFELAQSSDEDMELDLAQSSEEDMELDLAQTGKDDVFEGMANWLLQTDSNTKDSLGDLFVQTQSMAHDFIANMQPETREMFDNSYAQTRTSAYSWLSNADNSSRARVEQMLSQTSYGNYFSQTCVRPDVAEEMNNFFGQFESVEIDEDSTLAQLETDVMEAELDQAADYLSQIGEEKMEQLLQLI